MSRAAFWMSVEGKSEQGGNSLRKAEAGLTFQAGSQAIGLACSTGFMQETINRSYRGCFRDPLGTLIDSRCRGVFPLPGQAAVAVQIWGLQWLNGLEVIRTENVLPACSE